MRSRFHHLLAVGLAALVVVSLVRYFTGFPSTQMLLNVAVGTVVWAIPKGALIRFMGGARPYRSALAANAASEISSLGFPISWLGVPWPALGASLMISTVIEGAALVVMRTARTVACLVMALYMNIFAHVFLAGWFLWPDTHLAGGAAIFLSFLIFILPIFVVDRPV